VKSRKATGAPLLRARLWLHMFKERDTSVPQLPAAGPAPARRPSFVAALRFMATSAFHTGSHFLSLWYLRIL